MKLDKNQQRIAIVAAAALGIYLLYRWYESNNAGSSTTSGVAAPDTSGSDYASLAGQEQSDVAGLQNQEQSDVGGLSSAISGITGDIAGLTAGLQAATGQESSDVSSLQGEIASIGTGNTTVDRTATITTHTGGAFYKYYVKVTGHAPPASLQVSNVVYQMWKAGIPAAAKAVSKPAAHPSAPRNTQVAHPNPNHTAQTHKTNTAKQPTSVQRVTATVKPPPKPKPAPAKSKPKPSGSRK